MNRLIRIFLLLLALAFQTTASAQQYVLGVDSTANAAHLFSPLDGSLVQSNFLEWGSLGSGSTTAIHGLQVGNQIWVSDQLRDVIYRFNLAGNHVGTIGPTGLDNIRGMEVVGNEVWVTNTGTQNNAPGNALVRLDSTTGNIVGSTTNSVGMWDVVNYQGLVLASNSTNHNLEFYNLDGTFNSVFHSPTPPGLRFPQQLYVKDNGNVLAAGFSNAGGNITGVFEFDTVGNFLGIVAGLNLGPRGVFELDNGEIMWTNGSGFHVGANLVRGGSGRFLSLVTVPEPSGLSLVGLIALGLGLRRPRRSCL